MKRIHNLLSSPTTLAGSAGVLFLLSPIEEILFMSFVLPLIIKFFRSRKQDKE